ncbi:Carbonyl reductase family member 4 [Hypsizygus marmoreus]|uniref:Carbonyl reductase family member 4 n=1 Tax=Hypsizygus marmoreus TaxID=39966 RepID=A0A369JHE8_HYPMA|nr:Carbonyl reductase family member 4 [Hypsizygus marmoreus]
MSTAAARRVLVIAGLGKGSGTGASAARLFSKAGYSIALVARGADALNTLAQELNSSGGNAVGFPVEAYTPKDISNVWNSIRAKYPAPSFAIGAAIFNVGQSVWKPFLEITPEDVQESLQVNVQTAFAFSREAILTFKDNEISEPTGKKGTLIFTGATASLRGNTTTSAMAAGKFGLRALAQSLAKEFGKDNIHVAHAIIDGVIYSDRLVELRPELANDSNARLSTESIANAYMYLVNQDRSAWTWELDLRPAHEKW